MNDRLRIVGATLAVLVLVLVTACGSSSDPASAETCAELEDLVIESMQDWIDALERHDATVEQLQSTSDWPFDSDELKSEYDEIISSEEAIDEQWLELRCAGESWEVVGERADELTYTKRVGEYVIDQVTS